MGYSILGYIAESVGTAAIGAGVSSALAPKPPKINIPPPPGAALISPAGQAAAADTRRRAAASGGLQSTISGAGQAQPTGNATAGAKSLLGQ
jgi:hypothetical protein